MKSMIQEHEHAIDVAKAHDKGAAFWRGDIRKVENGPLLSGCNFAVIDDSNPNNKTVIGVFRCLTSIAAPEGYKAVLGVQSEAVVNQIAHVCMSSVIKSTVVHNRGVMGEVVSASGDGF